MIFGHQRKRHKGQAAIIRHYANQPAVPYGLCVGFQPGDLLCDCETLRNLRELSLEALERKRG